MLGALYPLARPLFRRLDPEAAHGLTVKSLGLLAPRRAPIDDPESAKARIISVDRALESLPRIEVPRDLARMIRDGYQLSVGDLRFQEDEGVGRRRRPERPGGRRAGVPVIRAQQLLQERRVDVLDRL